MYMPTSSHVLAPSYEPIVTSNKVLVFFFSPGVFWWYSGNFFVCGMMWWSCGVMCVNPDAQSSALASSCSVMDG